MRVDYIVLWFVELLVETILDLIDGLIFELPSAIYEAQRKTEALRLVIETMMQEMLSEPLLRITSSIGNPPGIPKRDSGPPGIVRVHAMQFLTWQSSTDACKMTKQQHPQQAASSRS